MPAFGAERVRISVPTMARLLLGELAYRKGINETDLLSHLLIREAANELLRETHTEHKSPVPDSEQHA